MFILPRIRSLPASHRYIMHSCYPSCPHSRSPSSPVHPHLPTPTPHSHSPLPLSFYFMTQAVLGATVWPWVWHWSPSGLTLGTGWQTKDGSCGVRREGHQKVEWHPHGNCSIIIQFKKHITWKCWRVGNIHWLEDAGSKSQGLLNRIPKTSPYELLIFHTFETNIRHAYMHTQLCIYVQKHHNN